MGDVEMNECALSNVEEMNQGAMVQRQIEKAEYETVSPHNKNDSVIEFKYVSEDCFIELNKTEIEVKLKIKKADGEDLDGTDNVGLINYAVATLFKDAEIQVNGKTITEGSSNYAERAIMEVLLTYGRDAEKTWLHAGGFSKDTAGKMDVANPSAADGNAGLKERAEYSKESRVVTLRGKLHEDLFNQPKPLPNKNRLDIKFTRHDDKYCLMSDAAGAAYKIEFESIVLYIRKLHMSNAVMTSLAGRDVVIPIDRVVQKVFSVPDGGSSYIQNSLHEGQIPTRIVFGFVANNAHTGRYKLNPFNFDHVHVKRFSLFHDGQLVNTRPIETDFEKGDVMQGYWSLHRATNTRHTNGGTLIELSDYKLGGYALWGYDLSPSQCDEQFIDPKRHGKLQLEVEFAKNIPKALSLCVYLQFDGEIKIDSMRNTFTLFN